MRFDTRDIWKDLENEDWSDNQPYKFVVRYLTLTAMTMLHEYLKLRYMSSDLRIFSPCPKPSLSILLLLSATSATLPRTSSTGSVGDGSSYV